MKYILKGVLVLFILISIVLGQTPGIEETFTTGIPSGWVNSNWATSTTGYDDGASITTATTNASIVTSSVVNPTNISFYYYSATASAAMSIAYSTSQTGPFTSLNSVATTKSTWTQFTQELTLSGTYYFQFTFTSRNKSIILDDVVISTKGINVSATTLSGFNYEPGGGPSTEQSFAVDGVNLIADLTITPPTNYEISTGTGAGFSATNPIVLTPSSGTVATTTIYVRLKSGLSLASYNGENITLSSTGANDKTVSCSGDVRLSINPSTSSLTGFVAEPGLPSPEQSFTISGQDLTADIILTSPTNYEMSESSGSGFGSTDITLTQSGGTVALTTIYVRLKSGLPAASYNGENITISSTGKISSSVSCSGDVRQSINPSTSTLSGFYYDPGSGPSSEQNFTVSGQDLTADITLTAPTNYEISTGTGAGFIVTNPITLTQTGGTVTSTTIYVRLKSSLSVGSYNGESITISSTGKTDRIITCNGSVGPMILNIKVFLEGGLW